MGDLKIFLGDLKVCAQFFAFPMGFFQSLCHALKAIGLLEEAVAEAVAVYCDLFEIALQTDGETPVFLHLIGNAVESGQQNFI